MQMTDRRTTEILIHLAGSTAHMRPVMLVPLSAPWNFYDLRTHLVSLCFHFVFPGPRARKPKKPATSSSAAGGGGGGVEKGEAADGGGVPEDKRPRTAFSGTQLARLKVR